MSRLLLVERETLTSLTDLAGRSILERLETEVVIIANKRKAAPITGLRNVVIEGVAWKDFSNPELLREKARSYHEASPFAAVATSDELLIETAGMLREALGLPGLDENGARRFRDKVEMKRIVGGHSIRVPHFVSAADRADVEALQWDHNKIVLKPRSEAGSRNVAFVESAADIETWYARSRDPAHFEAEEFIEGRLYHLNSIVIGGKVHLTACAEYLPGMANIDFRRGTPLTSFMLDDGPLRRRFEAYARDVIEAFAFEQGITHLECFLTPRDEIVFCEIAIRPPGGGVVGMIEAQYGVNLTLANLLLALGRTQEVLDQIYEIPAGRYGLAGLRDAKGGFIKAMPAVETFQEDWMEQALVLAKAGDFRAPCEHCTDYLARFIFRASDDEDYRTKLAELERRFQQTLDIERL